MPTADIAAEAGRGIQLIRALVDSVEFTPVDGRGTVQFESRSWRGRLAVRGAPPRHARRPGLDACTPAESDPTARGQRRQASAADAPAAIVGVVPAPTALSAW